MRFSSAVVQDLKDIDSYIADDNLDAAARFLKQLQKRWLNLADSPGIGRKRDDPKTHLRSASEGDYVIFYRKTENGIELIRILHAKRDLSKSSKTAISWRQICWKAQSMLKRVFAIAIQHKD